MNVRKWLASGLFTLAGALLGYFWSVNGACAAGGNCAILGNPFLSAVYVGVIGFLISLLIPRKKEQ